MLKSICYYLGIYVKLRGFIRQIQAKFPIYLSDKLIF